MSLLNSASLCVTPNAYKEGTLYSVIPNTTLGDMTVVRATTATRVNSAGLIEVVPYNLLRRSEEFNLIWVPVRSSITANSTTAPNGTLTADTLIDDTNNNIHYIGQTFTAINGAATISVYAKANQISQIQLVAQGGTTPMGRGFDLATGTTFAESVGGVISNDLGQSITDVGNGWYRCEMSWTSTGQNEFWILLSVSNAATFTGTGANGVYIWGAQAVQGTLPKDYLRTETRLNIPRLDYSNGSCPSLLVEPQRTNIALYSEQFDNAAWSKLGASVTANAATSPDGALTADKMVSISANTGAKRVEHTFSAVSGTTYTVSAYFKADGWNFALFNAPEEQFTTRDDLFLNLTNGTLSGSTSLGSVESVGNGWYRLKYTRIATASGSTSFRFGFSDTASISSTGDGTNGVLIWGAQLEVGSYATSYIPTTTAAVTRNADVISKTGISSLIGQTEGTVFLQFDNRLLTSYSNEYTFQIFGSGGHQLWMRKESGSPYFTARLIVSSSIIWTFTSIPVPNGNTKIAISYKTGDSAIYLNGTQFGSTNTAAFSGNSFTDFYFNLQGTSNPELILNQATLFPTRLTNAELASLTTL